MSNASVSVPACSAARKSATLLAHPCRPAPICGRRPQVPKNARATPRYLLKIQTEVDAMQQLGGSLDAVFLQASRFELGRAGKGIVLASWELG